MTIASTSLGSKEEREAAPGFSQIGNPWKIPIGEGLGRGDCPGGGGLYTAVKRCVLHELKITAEPVRSDEHRAGTGIIPDITTDFRSQQGNVKVQNGPNSICPGTIVEFGILSEIWPITFSNPTPSHNETYLSDNGKRKAPSRRKAALVKKSKPPSIEDYPTPGYPINPEIYRADGIARRGRDTCHADIRPKKIGLFLNGGQLTEEMVDLFRASLGILILLVRELVIINGTSRERLKLPLKICCSDVVESASKPVLNPRAIKSPPCGVASGCESTINFPRWAESKRNIATLSFSR